LTFPHFPQLRLFLICLPFLCCVLPSQLAAQQSKNRLATSQVAAQSLQSGQSVEREIKPGEIHAYNLEGIAGSFVEINISQRGSNVGVSLFGVNGKLTFSLNTTNDTEGTEVLPVLTEVSGVYRIVVRSRDRRFEGGRYQLSVSQSRAATPRDRNYVSAELLIQQARRLLVRRTEQSKRNAISKYKEALPFLRLSGKREREATVLNNIALFHESLGGFSEALAFHHQALDLRKGTGDDRGAALSLNHIGALQIALGEIQKGLDDYNQALAFARVDGGRRGEANTLANIGSVYFDLGESERALDFYDRALKLYRAIGGRPREVRLLTSIGSVHFSRGDNEKALELYERALALQKELNSRGGRNYTQRLIGLLHARLGNRQKAFDYLNQALEFERQIGNPYSEAQTLTDLGELYYGSNEKEKAFDYFNQALPLRRSTGDRQGEALTLYWIARLERDRGQMPAALAGITSAVNLIEGMRARIGSNDLRVSYFATVQKYYDFYIDLLAELHRQVPSGGYDALALQASERARARGLIELLQETRTDIRRGVDPALLQREQSLQRQLNERTEEQMQLLSGTHTPAQAKALVEKLAALSTEYAELQSRIRQTSPRYAALMQPEMLSAKGIQQSLDNETLLLEFRLGETRSFLWAVTPVSIDLFELPSRAEVERVARRVTESVNARNQRPQDESLEQRRERLEQAEKEFLKSTTELSRMLFSQVAARFQSKRLLIVSDGALQYVPFAALPAPRTVLLGENGTEAKGVQVSQSSKVDSQESEFSPLVADHEIISLPSASVIAVLRKERTTRPSTRKAVAVLADPVFDQDDIRVNQRAVKPVASRFAQTNLPRLPFSRREAESILAAAPPGKGMAALNFRASLALVKSPALAEYRILHFATHGLLDTERPELSAIVLSLVDEQGRPQDGFMRLREIYNLSLPAELVMLSACQTGLGKEIRGEGLVGLTRGFMYAGAARVGTSLWKVDDAATAELMSHFYQAVLREGKTPAAALRHAQMKMWPQKRWRSPYYWAAFVLQGDWK